MNNKAQFTPGPWDCDNDWAVGKRAINGSLDLIANLSYSCFQDAKQADANLIAAAPAMYEALRMLIALDPRCHRGVTHCGECGACLGQAALAQAEGKQ